MKYPHLPGNEELLADYIDQLRSLFQHADAIKENNIELENKEKAVRDFQWQNTESRQTFTANA